MNNLTKILFFILLPIIVIAVGAFAYSQINTTQNESTTETTTGSNATEPVAGTPEETKQVAGKPTTENPPDQGDVVAQPAYLSSAYTRHETDYIGVDYVMVFKGDEAIEAMVEDGVCTNISTCTVDPDGYVRNNNPHFRTYELSSTTPLTIQVSGAIKEYATKLGKNASNLTFEDLKEVLPTMPAYVPNKEHFKEAKTLVYLDIFGQGITKIREP
jgi:hypothetical protein